MTSGAVFRRRRRMTADAVLQHWLDRRLDAAGAQWLPKASAALSPTAAAPTASSTAASAWSCAGSARRRWRSTPPS